MPKLGGRKEAGQRRNTKGDQRGGRRDAQTEGAEGRQEVHPKEETRNTKGRARRPSQGRRYEDKKGAVGGHHGEK